MITLRPYQTEAVNSVFEYYYTGGKGHALLALPTGTGKSLILGELIRQVLQTWPGQRLLSLTHVKELIGQNSKTLSAMWPCAPIGIYSAGLSRRDHLHSIVYGGVASVHGKVELFGHRDLLLIDEAHLISPEGDTMYQQIISELKAINPWLKVIGLTATPFRLKQGMLTDSGLFTDIIFNLCDVTGWERLIRDGYLVPPVPKQTATEIDLTGVRIQNGEYNLNQLQAAVDRSDITTAACREMLQYAYDRNKWLIFCSGIEHAEHVSDVLNGFGVPSAAVHSKLKDGERDRRINAHKRGEIRAITNNNVLTTGYDDPEIDFIGMLRPTVSTVLWVQMLGRGTRPSPGKSNCLVLDFARNSVRLGPIDDPRIPGKPTKGDGDLPVKICDACGCYNHPRVRFCVLCGAEFEFRQKLVRTADTAPLLSTVQPEIKTFEIDHVFYYRHVSKNSGKASIKCVYHCEGMQVFNEYVNFDAFGYPRNKADEWWRQRHTSNPPLSTDLALASLSELRKPRKVRVWINKKYPEVLSVSW